MREHPYAVPHFFREVVPGRLELPTSTLSVWRSNQLSYRTVRLVREWTSPPSFLISLLSSKTQKFVSTRRFLEKTTCSILLFQATLKRLLQKGGVPAAPSGTATLLRLSPNHRFRPRPTLAVTDFRRPRLSWLDGRCVQGPGTYSPRHG